MGTLLPLDFADHDEVDDFLQSPPHVHLYLRSRFRDPDAGQAYVFRHAGEIRGFALFGSGQNLVLAGDDPDFLRALADLAVRLERSWVMVVGRHAATSLFLASYTQSSGRRARLDRSQTFCVQTPDTLPDLGEPELDVATLDDLEDLAAASARMSAEDFDIDPWKIDRVIVRRRMREKIEDGRSFILRRDGRLVFKVDLAVRVPYGAQVEGVFTAEDERGKGIATRSMAELGRRSLDGVEALTLHVATRNTPALKAYERSGYVRTGELRLAIFPYAFR